MKFPPGYGYPSRDEWQIINAENARPRWVLLKRIWRALRIRLSA